MTERSLWYQDMVEAARKRERALRMIARWQVSLDQAEATIKKLTAEATAANKDQEQE